jgi:S-adenosylmethionine decarboxylase
MSVFSKPLGVQLLAEFWECDAARIDNPAQIEQVMRDAAKVAGAEIIGSMFHEFEPQGVSGVVVISESHLTIHTWPEILYAAVDIFTCGEHVDPWQALEYVAKEFGAEEMHAMEINRGMQIAKVKRAGDSTPVRG